MATPTTQPFNPATLASNQVNIGNLENPNVITQPLDGSLLNQNSAVTVPNNPPAMSPQQFVAGLTPIATTPLSPVNPTAPGATSTATAQIGTLEGQRSSLTNRLAAAQQQLLGQGAEQQKLENEAGIPQSVKDLNALNEQITGLKAAFDAKNAATDTNTFGVNAQSTRIDAVNRQSAIQLGGLSSLALAKQGSLEAAKAQVDRTLALEFDPIKQEIENTKTFLDLNYQDLTRVEQSRADALRVQLDREARSAQIAQQNRTLNSNMALELYKQGSLDQTGFSNILSGKSTISDALKNTSINAATLGSDPLSSLQSIISSSGAKTDDKLKLTGSVIAAAQKFAGANPNGDFAGLGIIRPGPLTIGPLGQQNRTYLSGLAGTVESWMTGASVSVEQQARIRKDLIPRESDTDYQVRNKINALTNYMLDYASGNLATQGINYRPTTIDLFTVKTDPLGLGIDMNTINSSNPLGL